MFCPRCRAEYREEFTICADCNVDLVDELPPEPVRLVPEYVDYEHVLATYNPTDIALVKSVLDAEGITYFFQGERFTYVRPFVEPARLMVKKDQVREAVDLLRPLSLSYMSINVNKNGEKDEGEKS